MNKGESGRPLRRVGWGRVPLPWTRRRRKQAEQRGQQLLREAIARREHATTRGDAEEPVLGRETAPAPSAPYVRDRIRADLLAEAAERQNQGGSTRAGLNGGIVTEPRLDETIITLWGEIDDSLRTTASSAIAMALESKKPIALDLSDVDFMDSTGAAFLVQIKHYALDDGIKVTLRGASDAAMTVMEMLGTLDMFDSGASTSFTHLRTQPRHGPGGRPPEGLR